MLRSTLFVPATALEGLEAALASGADVVCIDQENMAGIEEARRAVETRMRAIQLPRQTRVTVRVNDVETTAGEADLALLLAGAPWLSGLMLPQVKKAETIRRVAQRAKEADAVLDLYVIIETLEGLADCLAIARAHPTLKALYFGGNDMSAALGCKMAWEPLLYARSRVVHAAALAGIPLLDSPFSGSVEDLEGLREDCMRASALGLRGKCARKPAQVATINAAFS